jgi:hypothetical protein
MTVNQVYHGIMTSGTSKTFTLPTVPADGSCIQILDSNNNFGNGMTSQTLAAGGPDRIIRADISGSVATYTMNVSSGWYELTYQSNSGLWLLRINKNWNVTILAANNIWAGTIQYNSAITQQISTTSTAVQNIQVSGDTVPHLVIQAMSN